MSPEALLIVDDDVVFGTVLARAMARRGFHTEVAQDPRTALQLAEQYTFHRAVIDLKLARESGLTLIQTLKGRHPELQIVMLTAYASISTAVEAIKLGACNYLCKPADADEILSAFATDISTSLQDIPANPLSIERLEWEHIQKILQENAGNISATARCLGMHRRTLQRKLQKRPPNFKLADMP